MYRIWRAMLNSWAGLVAAAKSEQAFREEIVALVLSVPLAFLIASEAWKRLMLIGVILLLMAIELLNTAIEKLSDHVTPHHPRTSCQHISTDSGPDGAADRGCPTAYAVRRHRSPAPATHPRLP